MMDRGAVDVDSVDSDDEDGTCNGLLQSLGRITSPPDEVHRFGIVHLERGFKVLAEKTQ